MAFLVLVLARMSVQIDRFSEYEATLHNYFYQKYLDYVSEIL